MWQVGCAGAPDLGGAHFSSGVYGHQPGARRGLRGGRTAPGGESYPRPKGVTLDLDPPWAFHAAAARCPMPYERLTLDLDPDPPLGLFTLPPTSVGGS